MYPYFPENQRSRKMISIMDILLSIHLLPILPSFFEALNLVHCTCNNKQTVRHDP